MTTTTEQMREALQYVFDKMYVDNNTGNWALESDFDDNVLHSALAASPAPQLAIERKIYRKSDEWSAYLNARFADKTSNSFEFDGHRWMYRYTSFDDDGDYELIYRAAPQLEAAQPAPVPEGWKGYVSVVDGQFVTPSRTIPDGTYALIDRKSLDAAPAQQEQAPRSLTDKELADPEYMRAYVSELQDTIAELLSRHPAQPVNPVAYAVFDGNEPVYCASYSTACQEHINDAINEFHVEGAEKWRVVPLYAAPVSQDIASLKEQNAELVKALQPFAAVAVEYKDDADGSIPVGHSITLEQCRVARAAIASAHQENKE